MSSSDISIMSLSDSLLFLLVVFPFMLTISGPSTYSAMSISFKVISLSFTKFMVMIIFKSCIDGIPIAYKNFLATLGLSICFGDKKNKFSLTVVN